MMANLFQGYSGVGNVKLSYIFPLSFYPIEFKLCTISAYLDKIWHTVCFFSVCHLLCLFSKKAIYAFPVLENL